ncbi:hypothetical protein LOTGIDRAFT_228123 [Lottia gigantea]|uniref:Ig-like domain-containing protein n=1 Tax=Lottia gigantea TaxID=225164 RepID=V4B553_LOTGI|nr:hypothetical protein LOTGIDRAFT_228123 [Lottia gigantea]ESP05623.1 hypothetical protein LOTGIDRAFT_228123 [Lottia gigantea]
MEFVLIVMIVPWITTMSSLKLHDTINEKTSLPMDYPEPQFLNSVTNITVREGSLAILPCTVQHLGTKQVAWRRLDNDHFLTIGTLTWVKDVDIQIEHRRLGDITDWDLLIKHVRPDHDGLYECQITSVEKYVRHVTLHVQATVVKGRKCVQEGQELKIVCNTTGKKKIPDDVTWLKDDQPINSSYFNHVVVTNYRSLGSKTLVSVLSVNTSKMADSGVYICQSSLAEVDSINITILKDISPNVKRGADAIYVPEVSEDYSGNKAESRYSTTCVQLCLIVLCVFLTVT